MAEAHRGLAHTAETRQKIATSRLGTKHPLWKGPNASYAAVHIYLGKHCPKSGVCEECEREVGITGASGTQHALIHGREYSRSREDYRELCPRCHLAYDAPLRHKNRDLVAA